MDRTTIIGPYFECKNVLKAELNVTTICKQHGAKKTGNCCNVCGRMLEIQGIYGAMVRTINPWDACEDFEEFRYIMDNTGELPKYGAPDGFQLDRFYDETNPCALDISDHEVLAEEITAKGIDKSLTAFEKDNDEFIERLIELYGEQNVVIKYGVIQSIF